MTDNAARTNGSYQEFHIDLKLSIQPQTFYVCLEFEQDRGHMVDDVTRFPVSTWTRIKNKRGKRTVNCEISGRYLKYGKGHDTGTNMGVLISMDVMTDGNDSSTSDRKICELVLPLDELKELVRLTEQDVEAQT